MPTAQAAAFDLKVKETGGASKTATLLECSVPHVSLIRQGKRKPSRALASRIEKLLGLSAGGWDE